MNSLLLAFNLLPARFSAEKIVGVLVEFESAAQLAVLRAKRGGSHVVASIVHESPSAN
ncbi:hypothetical protein OHT76_15840 [Streptomyces sp. NBC_00287]|uniref:hypothetical protein n=1 Tax=Streptomyces sp. NBC_00287 TaxID=2975702 RepID=UPI002E2A9CCE|nr:hypothetical protein [Streptomyces sp. NBC_00287]